MPTPKWTLNQECVPCVKEILCQGRAVSLLDAGHTLVVMSQLTDRQLEEWIHLVDGIGDQLEKFLGSVQ